MFETWLFYAFAAVLLVSGMLVITARNPVHGVLFLVLAFFTAAGIWLLLRAEFLAIALVVVYVGAVMVLFLFVVMMLDINLERVREGFWRNLPLALLVGGIMVAEMVAVLANRYFATRVQELPPGAELEYKPCGATTFVNPAAPPAGRLATTSVTGSVTDVTRAVAPGSTRVASAAGIVAAAIKRDAAEGDLRRRDAVLVNGRSVRRRRDVPLRRGRRDRRRRRARRTRSRATRRSAGRGRGGCPWRGRRPP